MADDLIDRHIDLRRRVRRLETMPLGRPGAYEKRSAHPSPIAEHLRLHTAIISAVTQGGAVARWLARAEQLEENEVIHRLLRVARERLQTIYWIGNLSSNFPMGGQNRTGPGYRWYIDVPNAAPAGVETPEIQAGVQKYTQHGLWLYPWILPSQPQSRQYSTNGGSVGNGGGGGYAGVGLPQPPPQGSLSDGLLWTSASQYWAPIPATLEFGYPDSFNPAIPGPLTLPEDGVAICHGNLLPVEMGVVRGTSYNYTSNPFSVYKTNPSFVGGTPAELKLDTADQKLKSIVYAQRTSPEIVANQIYGTSGYYYAQDAQSGTTRAYYFPTDQIRSNGPPIAIGRGVAANYPRSSYDGLSNGRKPYSTPSKSDTIRDYENVLSSADMAPLAAWYDAQLAKVPAGEWLADAATKTIAVSRDSDERKITYDHQWNAVYPSLSGASQYAEFPGGGNGEKSGWPQFNNMAAAEAEWSVKNGLVRMRGIAFDSGFQYLLILVTRDFGSRSTTVFGEDGLGVLVTPPVDLAPSRSQFVTLIGGSGLPYLGQIYRYSSAYVDLRVSGNNPSESFYYLDQVVYSLT